MSSDRSESKISPGHSPTPVGKTNESPPDPRVELPSDATELEQIERLCLEFEGLITSTSDPTDAPVIEMFLERIAESRRSELFLELLLIELNNGVRPSTPEARVDCEARFPAYLPMIAKAWHHRLPPEHAALTTPDARTTPPLFTPGMMLDGKYEILAKLGQGGYGLVLLAREIDLDRKVAIKTPRPDLPWSEKQLNGFRSEAKKLARFEKRGIAAIYNVFETPIQGHPYLFVVQQYIDGKSLAAWWQDQDVEHDHYDLLAQMLAAIASILATVHKEGFFHRDLKPENIWIDRNGQPYVLDFGLALHIDERTSSNGLSPGTIRYMAPEQVRGETLRIDGCTDIWAMGVILYQFLAGRLPFLGATESDLFEAIKHADPQPPRQIRSEIPAELERITLKCLAKEKMDRYATMLDLASDLQAWRNSPAEQASGHQSVRIVPKGLRSFDCGDADFFLELLPGGRERNLLPLSVNFWKERIESGDPALRMPIGVLFGPSGCGKSSLMKAGLLPRLKSSVLTVYLEATQGDTESRLLRMLRHACKTIPVDLGLVEVMEGLASGQWIPVDSKVLVVIDQFEQWLYVQRDPSATILRAALGQCNGDRVQAILMVRNEYWTPISSFVSTFNEHLAELRNCMRVSLFDLRHARKVLSLFGQAYGALAADPVLWTADQNAFLDSAVVDLSEAGKVVCVRIALFADLMRGREWLPRTLDRLGGVRGVGVAFLEESFTSRDSSPIHGRHAAAAQRLLRDLMPPAGSEIKGHFRTDTELAAAAEYSGKPREYAELIRILDDELRLITPASDDEGRRTGYQLTHDYLVPSLREWLARKQRETRRGRAELHLEDRSAIWNATNQENRQLPSLWEFLTIHALTNRPLWSDSQRTMMARAAKWHAARSAVGAIALSMLLTIGLLVRDAVARRHEATRIEGLVGQLISAEPNQLPGIIRQLQTIPDLDSKYLAPFLSNSAEAMTPNGRRSQLHARLAVLSRDPSLVSPLVEELLEGKVVYVVPIRQQLRPFSTQLVERFRALLRDESATPRRRFRAAMALAEYTPSSETAAWSESDLRFIAEQLTSSNAEFQPLLRDALRPIKDRLLRDLESIFRDGKGGADRRISAANAFADYGANNVAKLTELLIEATPPQYEVLFPLVVAERSPAMIAELSGVVATLPPGDLGSVERVSFGQRRANAAVTLLRFGELESAMAVFQMTDDPEALTQFIFRCRPRGIGADALLDCLDRVSVAPKGRYPLNSRYALLLALGEFQLSEIPAARRIPLLEQVKEWYAYDPSSGVHGAAGWLLRQWGETAHVLKVDQTPVPYSPDREWFTLSIAGDPRSVGRSDPKLIGANKMLHFTFIVFPAGTYEIGSIDDEPGRDKAEVRRQVQLPHSFALLDREITWDELIAYNSGFRNLMTESRSSPDGAGGGAAWYDAVGFCRWFGSKSGLPESEQAYAAPTSLDKAQFPRESLPRYGEVPRDWPLDLRKRGFRLPRASEWEVASRGGVKTSYGFGGEVRLLEHFGWFIGNSRQCIHSPRELRPNLRGIFDLHGNMFEWTHDWIQEYNNPGTIDPTEASERQCRGGSWTDDPSSCRSAFPFSFPPTRRTANIGFRLARSLDGLLNNSEGLGDNQSK